MRLVSTTEKPADLRRGISEEWRTPRPDEEDSEEKGHEMEVSSQKKEYIPGATSRYADFHRVMQAADRAGHQVPPSAASAIRSLGDSDRMDVVHYLGTHPREIQKLHKLSPEASTSRIHELLSQAKQQQESSSAASLPLEGISFKEFSRRRDAQERARRRR
jgi:hypothetical protein